MNEPGTVLEDQPSTADFLNAPPEQDTASFLNAPPEQDTASFLNAPPAEKQPLPRSAPGTGNLMIGGGSPEEQLAALQKFHAEASVPLVGFGDQQGRIATIPKIGPQDHEPIGTGEGMTNVSDLQTMAIPKDIAAGVINAGGNIAAGLSSPENIGLMIVTGGLNKALPALGRLGSMAFGGVMGKQALDQYRALKARWNDPTFTRQQKIEAAGELGGTILMGAAAAGHVIKGVTDTAGLTGERAQARKATLDQIRQTPGFAGFKGSDSELVDAVKARLAAEGARRAKRVTAADVSEAEEFNRKVAGLLGPGETPPAAPEAPPAVVPPETPGETGEPMGPHQPEGPPAPAPATATAPPERPHLATSSNAQIMDWAESATEYDKNIDTQVFGDRTDEYRKASRQANSSNPETADRGIAKQHEMESGLTPEQEDTLYGKNLPPGYLDKEGISDLVDKVNAIDATGNADELVRQNSKLMQKMLRASAGKGELNPEETELVGRLANRARELGATPTDLIDKYIRYRGRFEGDDVFELAGTTPEQVLRFLVSQQPSAPPMRTVQPVGPPELMGPHQPEGPPAPAGETRATESSPAQSPAASGGQGTDAPSVAGSPEVIPGPRSVTGKKTFRFAKTPDGGFDLIDAIQDGRGVPQPPIGAKGGEWDEYQRTFSGSARILRRPRGRGEPRVNIDQYLQDLAAQYPQFHHLTDPRDFYDAVGQALEQRRRMKRADEIEQQTGKLEETLYTGEGRPSAVKAGPEQTDETTVGDEFKVKRQDFKITHIDPDDGSVTAKDGPRYGTVILPAGSEFFPDKGTYKKVVPGEFIPGENEPEPPQTAAMGTSAPRQTPGQKRVAEAELRDREKFQDRTGVTKAASSLAKAMPETTPVKWFRGLRALFAAHTLSDEALQTALSRRATSGAANANNERARFALEKFLKEFDRTPVPRTWKYEKGQPLPRNYDIQSSIDTGRMGHFTPAERAFAEASHKLLSEAVDMVQGVAPDALQNLRENYFPRLLKDAPDKASKLNRLFARRPLEGSKSFMQKRTLELFTDAFEHDLVPVSDNPAEMSLLKLGEMYKFVAARQFIEQLKQKGLYKFKYVYEQMRDGWRVFDDPSSNIWKPPVVTVQEAYDAQMRAKTLEMLEALGIPHERLTKLGGNRWGDANSQMGIRTKFAGPDFVFWHEAGHMLDWRYPDIRTTVLGGTMKDVRSAEARGRFGHELSPEHEKIVQLNKEMRALADLRFEGQTPPKSYEKYVRKTAEKIANMFDAYIRAPERFKQVAPNVWQRFNQWLDGHPEVRVHLDDIKPSLTMGTGKSELFVGGPIKLGDWIMPEDAAQVMDNLQQSGLGKYALYRGFQRLSGLVTQSQLAGLFHAQMVMNDSFASGLALAGYDALTGKPIRAIKEFLQAPISPFQSIYRGHQIERAIRDPANATENAKKIGQLAIEANLRAARGPDAVDMTRMWTRAMREFLAAPNTGAAWESFWRAPFALLQTLMKPIMEHLVPQMKLGMFARMAQRIVEDNPGASLEELRQHLAVAADNTEDRVGQVNYDNLFMNRTLKDTAQGTLRSSGWQGTKYRLIGVGAYDWAKAAKDVVSGKKPTITFRMTYLPAMVAAHMIISATVQYLLTGKPPQSKMDYFFPDTGLKDKNGRPIRVAIADFVKDIIGDWRSFPDQKKMRQEWSHKLAPIWGMIAEMMENRDFYGEEILSDRQVGEPESEHLLKNLKEGAEYLGKTAAPFSATAGKRFTDAGARPAYGYGGPIFGFVPAPRYATETPMQSFLSDYAGRDTYTRTHEQAEGSKMAREIAQAQQDGKPLSAEQVEAMRTMSQQQLTKARNRVTLDPDIWAVRALDINSAMKAWDLANHEERMKILPTIRNKISNARDNGGHNVDTLNRYEKLLNREELVPQPNAANAPAPALEPAGASR